MFWGVTRIDLVEGDAKAGREFLLDIGAGLVLGEEMLLEDVMLVLCEARLDIAARRFGRRRRSCRGRDGGGGRGRGRGGVHGAASSDEAGRARRARGKRIRERTTNVMVGGVVGAVAAGGGGGGVATAVDRRSWGSGDRQDMR